MGRASDKPRGHGAGMTCNATWSHLKMMVGTLPRRCASFVRMSTFALGVWRHASGFPRMGGRGRERLNLDKKVIKQRE